MLLWIALSLILAVISGYWLCRFAFGIWKAIKEGGMNVGAFRQNPARRFTLRENPLEYSVLVLIWSGILVFLLMVFCVSTNTLRHSFIGR